MKKYLAKKLVQYILVLFAVSIVIFVMVRLGGADPVAVILGGKQSTPETIENVRKTFNLDKPATEQYGLWIKNMLAGDFGTSFQYRQSVTALIIKRLPVTAGLVLIATLISALIAIPSGILAAIRQNSFTDSIISFVQLVLVASPPFFVSLLMIWFITTFAPTYPFTGSYQNLSQYLQRLFLPSVALSFSMIALTSRVVKTSMVEQLSSNYRMMATAKGVSGGRIIWRHCLKNALIPVITILGTQIGILIVGSVLVEHVFSLAGLGSILIEGIKASDYPIVQGVTMLLVFVFLTISTLLDILYAVIDPQIRLK